MVLIRVEGCFPLGRHPRDKKWVWGSLKFSPFPEMQLTVTQTDAKLLLIKEISDYEKQCKVNRQNKTKQKENPTGPLEDASAAGPPTC